MKERMKLVTLLFEGYELLDVYGPLEMFGVSRMFDIKTAHVGISRLGPQVVVDYALDNEIDKIDLLLIPGGIVENALNDEKVIKWVKKMANKAKYVMTVCNGAAILAKTGLLDGKKATTNKMDFKNIEKTYPNVEWVLEARWIVDGKFHSSSGVSAGSDLACFLISKLGSEEKAQWVADVSEYERVTDPLNDPFYTNAEGIDFDKTKLKSTKKQKVAFVLFDNFEMFDTFGPLEMIVAANKFCPDLFEVTTFAEDKLVKSSEGPTVKVDEVWEENMDPEKFDIVFIPGGMGTIRDVYNKPFQNWFRKLVNKADKVMTVCSGAAILGSMGILDGKRATTNKLSIELLALYGKNVKWQKSARWVVDGKFYTSSGVTAGTDLALYLISEMYGEHLADCITRRTEYNRNTDPSNDPFAVKHISSSWTTYGKKLFLDGLFSIGFALGYKMHTSTMSFLQS